MTTTQLDHLRLIDAHLERLLDIAAKRTPGEWKVNNPQSRTIRSNQEQSLATMSDDSSKWHHNAAYIASCAGNAEAGWKATRAAIAGYLKASIDDSWAVSLVASEVLESILAAFPLETLNPQKP